MVVSQRPLIAAVKRAIVQRTDAISKRFAVGRTSAVLEQDTLVFDDYQYTPTPRFGVTAPALPWLKARLEAQAERLEATLDMCASVADGLSRISLTEPADARDPYWLNPWIIGLDCAWLYGSVRGRAPKTFLEIGSGNSTKFVRRAITDGNLSTRLISIDPYPRAEIDSLCDAVHRSPLENVDLAIFDVLEPGDILFFDGSHRSFQNSDVTVFFLEVLPRLPAGVVVAIHDMFLPFDYPADWTVRLYNEQYVLAAYLLGREQVELDFAARWIGQTGRFADRLETLFSFDPAKQINRDGGLFSFIS